MHEVIAVLLWPAVVLLLGVTCIVVFRKDIRTLLARLKQAKLPGGTEADFSLSAEMWNKLNPPDPDKPPDLKWQHSGNLFWIGYDLGQAITLLSQGGSKDQILVALRQVVHHAQCLGADQLPNRRAYTLPHLAFPDAPTTYVISESILGRLSRIMTEIQRTTDATWERKRKETLLREVSEIRDLLSKWAEENQTGFQAKS